MGTGRAGGFAPCGQYRGDRGIGPRLSLGQPKPLPLDDAVGAVAACTLHHLRSVRPGGARGRRPGRPDRSWPHGYRLCRRPRAPAQAWPVAAPLALRGAGPGSRDPVLLQGECHGPQRALPDHPLWRRHPPAFRLCRGLLAASRPRAVASSLCHDARNSCRRCRRLRVRPVAHRGTGRTPGGTKRATTPRTPRTNAATRTHDRP